MDRLRVLAAALVFAASAGASIAQAHRPAEPPVSHPVAAAPASPAQPAPAPSAVAARAESRPEPSGPGSSAIAQQTVAQPRETGSAGGWRPASVGTRRRSGYVRRATPSSAGAVANPVQPAPASPAAGVPAPAVPAAVESTAAKPAARSSAAAPAGNGQRRIEAEGRLRRALGAAASAAGLLARLALVLALAYLFIVALKFLYSRTGRPLKFGERLLQVEESAPLGGGAAVHLVRIGEQRWLVGTAQGQVSILSAVNAAGEAGGAPETRRDAPTLSGLLNAGILSGQTTERARRGNSPAEKASPARLVSGELRQTSSFIDEMRARLQAGRPG